MKFEIVKANAKRTAVIGFGYWEFAALSGVFLEGSKESIDAIMPFVLAAEASSDEMRAFVAAFMPQNGWIAASKAKGDVMHGIVFRANKAGLDLIDKWDIEELDKLIELFPYCVPPKYKSKNRPKGAIEV